MSNVALKEPVKYPEVKHKIPELFKLIIKADDLLELLRLNKTPNFEQFKKVKKERRDFTRAAEEYIKRQKGGKE